ILAAAHGMEWLSMVIVGTVIGTHLLLWRGEWRRELLLIFCGGALGVVVDSANAAAGVFTFSVNAWGVPWLTPPFLIALWMLFPTTLNVSLKWLQGRPLVGAAFGAVGGPLSYYAGMRLGALEMGASSVVFFSILAVEWAILMGAAG